MMERFIKFWGKYVTIGAAARKFVEEQQSMLEFETGEFYKDPDDDPDSWCFMLEGLAEGYTVDKWGKLRIHWFSRPDQGFTGPAHLYTRRGDAVYIRFCKHSCVLQLPATKMREAKETFPEISELIHVMKQQFIDRQKTLVRILQVMDATERIRTFKKEFRDLFFLLTPVQLADHLNLSLASVYRALNDL